jgi:anti-sigma factor (TIGR02949 family)
MDAKKNLSCEEAVRAFFGYLDRALSGEPLDALERHLRDCLDCCERLEFSRQVDRLVKARLVDGVVPDGVEERLRERLAQRRERSNHAVLR